MNDNAKNKFKSSFHSAFDGWDYTELQDTVGFTLRGEYTPKVFKALRVDEGYKYVPFLNFYFSQDAGDLTDSEYLNLVVNVGISMIEKNENGSTRYILDNSHMHSKLNKPIEIKTVDDYSFNVKSGEFFRERKGKYIKTDLLNIYKEVMRLHIASYRNFVGLRARIKVFSLRSVPLLILDGLAHVFGLLTWIINGQFYAHDPFLEAFSEEVRGYERIEKSNEEPAREIDFFGYKVSVWTLFSYSVFAILIFLVIFHFENRLFNWIGSMQIVTVAFAIASIILYDRIAPRYFRLWIRAFSNKSSDLKFKGVRLKI